MALTTNVPHAIPQMTSYMQNGMSNDLKGTKFPLQFGVPIQNSYMFRVIPAALSADCISSANAWNPGGQPLNQTDTGSAPNIISKAINLENITGSVTFNRETNVILLDCERCVSFTLSHGQSGDDSVVTANGFDYLGNAVSTSVNLLGGVPQTYFIFPTPMSIVTSVVFSEDFGEGISCTIGNTNYIGLPYFLSQESFVQSCTWDGSVMSNMTAVPGYYWRDTGTSVFTGPTRGYIRLPSDADGSSLLTCYYYVSGSDSELNAELNNGNQSSLKQIGVRKTITPDQNGNNPYLIPYLTKYDLTGVVYPADADFINAYYRSFS